MVKDIRSRLGFVKGNENIQDDVMIWISKLPSAFEVYWDGELIGKNGKVAQSIQYEQKVRKQQRKMNQGSR